MEELLDLINSETEKSRVLSLNGVTGSITSMINEIRKKILEISANIEVNIDYPEYEDAIELTNVLIKPKVIEIKKQLNADYFIDGGESELGISSTIVKVIDGKPQILRQGSITLEEIEKEI